MEKGIIAAIATGLLGLWLYLSFSQQHDADRATFQAKQSLEAAKFDREFSDALGKKPTPEQDADIKAAKDELSNATSVQRSVQSERQSEVAQMKTQTEQEMGQQGVNVGNMKKQLERADK